MSTPQDNAGVSPGPGWRLLESHEQIRFGDELCDYSRKGAWMPVQESIGDPVHQWDYLAFRRRRDALPQPQPPPAPASSLSAQIRALPPYGNLLSNTENATACNYGCELTRKAAAELADAVEVKIVNHETVLTLARSLISDSSAMFADEEWNLRCADALARIDITLAPAKKVQPE